LGKSILSDKDLKSTFKSGSDAGYFGGVLIVVKTIFEIPEKYSVESIIAVGYPAVIPLCQERGCLKE